ncbi:predicted protein [Plenodomus lingam JN3]|uniref:Predicted protein n=1 Tax=Leptosphaeria maculans (strain JN3 / isolate v23.1.3 / race Av1-4-5-6-7-8) TaxID=985895 RepID=E4ZUI5_LEPMJ|nr:predicted protein [Plenodomus lingam JN3]CBX95064.1 predicted protein [Plenodomus lingam JN3]
MEQSTAAKDHPPIRANIEVSDASLNTYCPRLYI